mgnify:CR=1 FL=1
MRRARPAPANREGGPARTLAPAITSTWQSSMVGVAVEVGTTVGALEIVGWTESVGLSIGAAVGGQTNVSEPAPPEKSGIPSPVSSHDTSDGQSSLDTANV